MTELWIGLLLTAFGCGWGAVGAAVLPPRFVRRYRVYFVAIGFTTAMTSILTLVYISKPEPTWSDKVTHQTTEAVKSARGMIPEFPWWGSKEKKK